MGDERKNTLLQIIMNTDSITIEIKKLISYIKENGYQIIVCKNDYTASGFAKKYIINAGDSDDKILTELRIFKTKIAYELEKEMFVNRPFIKNIEDIINETK